MANVSLLDQYGRPVIQIADEAPPVQADPLVNPRASSIRLFFAKQSELDSAWHICDAALGSWSSGEGTLYVALHGARMYVGVKADTVLQADLRRGVTDGLCQRCMEELILAADLVKDRRLLRFE